MAKKGRKPEAPKGPATITNRRALFDYHVLDTVEAGLVLVGSEVKSLYHGRANLTDSYVKLDQGEAYVIGLDIEQYTFSKSFAPERRRERKLLLHKKEIKDLHRQFQEKGNALIPLKIYFVRGKAKLQVGVCTGKKQYDKRDSIAKRESSRQEDRARKGNYD